MTPSVATWQSASDVETVRRFNRLYTQAAGLLWLHCKDEVLLSEARALFEIKTAMAATATDGHDAYVSAASVHAHLDLSSDYFQSILRKLHARKWITAHADDQQPNVLTRVRLTQEGEEFCTKIIDDANQCALRMLTTTDKERKEELFKAMQQIESILHRGTEASAPQQPTVVLRSPEAGDMGWIVQMHGQVYANEYGWNDKFEALCAQICADFVMHRDEAVERCWIAVKDGVRVGCVFVVRGSAPKTAKLRLLLLTAEARGLGLGKRLMNECLTFARSVGYDRMELWTNSTLIAARQMYAKLGFEKIKTEEHTMFGPRLVGETWVKELR